MAGFRLTASARYAPTLVAGLLPHHCPATRVISTLHLPPAGYLCFTRACIVRRRGSGAASSPRVPPLRTPAEESLSYFNDSRRTRRRRHASLPAAVAVACALGTACLLRVAVFVAPLSLSRLARSRSIPKAAASVDGNSDPHRALTPIMLEKILLGRQTDSAKIHLVHHVFTAVLRTDQKLQLLELVYQLAFPENDITQQTEVFPKDWLGDEHKLEVGLAMAQIHMEMNKYQDAQHVLERLLESTTPPSSDKRVQLLKDAVDLVLSNCNILRDMSHLIIKLFALIAESKDLETPPC